MWQVTNGGDKTPIRPRQQIWRRFWPVALCSLYCPERCPATDGPDPGQGGLAWRGNHRPRRQFELVGDVDHVFSGIGMGLSTPHRECATTAARGYHLPLAHGREAEECPKHSKTEESGEQRKAVELSLSEIAATDENGRLGCSGELGRSGHLAGYSF